MPRRACSSRQRQHCVQEPASSAARAGGRAQARAQAATPRVHQLHPSPAGGRARASTAPSPTLGGGKPRAARRASTAGGGNKRRRGIPPSARSAVTHQRVRPSGAYERILRRDSNRRGQTTNPEAPRAASWRVRTGVTSTEHDARRPADPQGSAHDPAAGAHTAPHLRERAALRPLEVSPECVRLQQ